VNAPGVFKFVIRKTYIISLKNKKMKRTSILALISFFILSSLNFQMNAQEKTNQQKTKENRTIDARYTGELNQQDLINSPYTSRWFEPRFKSYHPDKTSMQTIENNIHDYELVMFMGAWCPDSHREVPRVFKILEDSGYDMDKLKVYTLNTRKQSADKTEQEYGITNVPTVIFFKDGKEVNRFVERPRETIAKDFAKIVSGEDYRHFHLR